MLRRNGCEGFLQETGVQHHSNRRPRALQEGAHGQRSRHCPGEKPPSENPPAGPAAGQPRALAGKFPGT